MNYYKPVFRYLRRPFKRFKLFLKQKAGWLGVPKIICHRGFGNESEFFITGRVVEDSGLVKPYDRQNVWQNILATIKRFSSDEIAGVNVRATWGDNTKVEETDEYGYFNFQFTTDASKIGSNESNWIHVQFELLDDVVENQGKIASVGEVLITSSREKRIIVSDIDDTVLISHSTQVLKKLRLMLFRNALSRMPFEGVGEFYRVLEKGKSGKENYPFFFVSSSEWNLYDLLEVFFSHNDIPKGVFLLKKLSHSIYKFWKSGGGNHEHKYKKIKSLMEFYKSTNFILIGDSGQRDPEIYKRLAMEFPGRVEAIYIRKVRSKKELIFSDTQEELTGVNTTFLEMQTTFDGIKHAEKEGYIAPQ